MAHQILSNARLFVAQYDLSGHANEAALDYAAEALDDTTLDKSTRTHLGGLKVVAVQMSGLLEAGVGMPDPGLFDQIGVADVPVSLCAVQGAAEGDRAFTFLADFADLTMGGPVGDIHKFSAGAEASQGPLVLGLILHNTTRTVSGNGGGQQLGALSAVQKLYAALHVLAVSGGTPALTVKIQSDDNGGFSSPMDRITFTVANGVMSEWKFVAGAVADDWWRVNYTITGTTPSFKFAGIAGIGPLS